jgi:hypothetical protein
VARQQQEEQAGAGAQGRFRLDSSVVTTHHGAEMSSAADFNHQELVRIRQAVADMANAFDEFDTANRCAQKMYHNCQEWTDEELDPINAARAAFFEAFERAKT